MKLYVSVLAAVFLLLSGCSSDEDNSTANVSNESEEVTAQTETKEKEGPSQEELNKELKEKANPIDFPVSDQVKVDDPVSISGTVTVGPEGGQLGESFSVETEGGIFKVTSLQMDTEIEEGDQVTIYGSYNGLDESTAIPTITATLIEK